MKFNNKEDFKDRWAKSLKEMYGDEFPDSICNFTSELAWKIFNKGDYEGKK